MAITWTFDAGRPSYDWEQILFDILQNGAFETAVSGTEVHMVSGTYTLILTGTGIVDGTSTTITASTITGLQIMDGAQSVWTMTGIAGATGTTINTAITDVDLILGVTPETSYYSEDFKDSLSGLVQTNIIGTGSGDADSIFGTNNVAGADTINGGDGNDYIRGGGFAGAADSLDGGNDWDYLDLAFDDLELDGVVVNVDAGEVRTNNIANTLVATIANFEGYGLTSGDDIFNGGGGDEFIQGLDGSDQIDGGGGWDKVSYRNEDGGLGIIVNVDAGTVRDTYNNIDYVINVEGFKGSQYGDVFTGSGSNAQGDYFEGMDGIDFFYGNGGRDMVDYQWEFEMGGTAGVVVNLADDGLLGIGTDGWGNNDQLYDITDLGGTQYIDTLNGNSSGNWINGYEGNDIINGFGGHDELRGEGGNDTINGGDGDDRIRGGDGTNILYGEAGNDRISGGRGNDTVTAGSGEFDNISGSSGTDTVDGNEGFDMLSFEADLDNLGEHAADSITVILTAGTGTGTVTGAYWLDSNGDPSGIVDTTFQNLERVVGTIGADTFTSTSGSFVNTDDAKTSFFGVRGIGGVFSFTGGAGADTFNITNNLAMIDYDEEKWRQPGYDGDHQWGSQAGEDGVVINMTAAGQSGSFGLINYTLAANEGRDTFGNIDIFAAANAFRLTDANDLFWGSDTDTYVEGRGGDDTMSGGSGNDSFNGGDGNDAAFGNGGSDEFNGDDGDDQFHGDSGRDYAWGGNGSDFLNGGTGNDELRGDDGTDTLNGDDGNDNIDGGNDNDIISGGNGNDELRGGNEHDVIHGNAGDDRIEGDQGDDNIFGDAGEDDVRGYDGIDRVSGGLGGDRIEGNELNDILSGDDDLLLNESIAAATARLAAGIDVAGGADWMSGGDGNDLMFGGYGADDMNGDNGNDTMYGGQGTDHMSGQADNDILHGGDGDDDMYGDEGNDTINGNNGNDFMSGWIGIDIMHGNVGNDRLNGDDGNDQLFGDAGNDVLEAGANDDTLDGGTNDDILWAGSGNDILIGGAGVDRLEGEGGNDTYRFFFANNDLAQDTIIENSGTADKIEYDSSISLAGFGTIENLTLTGAVAANGTGNNLANVITGNNAVNVLSGGIGNDTLSGLLGNDVLNGGANNDRLTGGKGADSLTGSTNFDTFAFAAGDSGLLAATLDTVADYAKGAVGVGDEFDYTAVLTRGGNALAATATQASVSATTGVATFLAGNGLTLADALADINGRFTAAGNAAGEFAFFKVAGAGFYHLFISDGVAGLGANDVLIKCTNLSTIGSINLAGGDLTILT